MQMGFTTEPINGFQHHHARNPTLTTHHTRPLKRNDSVLCSGESCHTLGKVPGPSTREQLACHNKKGQTKYRGLPYGIWLTKLGAIIFGELRLANSRDWDN